MKVFRIILTIIACALIVVGAFYIVHYELSDLSGGNAATAEAPAPQQQEETPPDAQADASQQEDESAEPAADAEDAAAIARAKEILSGMTLTEKIWQMIFTSPESITDVAVATRAGDSTMIAIQSQPIGGLIYEKNNLEDAEQVKTMLGNTQSYTKIPLFLAIDEEGGDVAPVASKLGTTSFQSISELAKTGTPQDAKEMGHTIAQDINSFGFNVTLAPVADLYLNDTNNLIRTRTYGSDPDAAAQMIGAEVEGLQSSGSVLAAAIHFPGIGRAEDVAHTKLTAVDATLDDLREKDLKPFIAAIEQKVGFIVVSHAIFSGVDTRPCSMSSAVMTDLLRTELGYNGIIITDALNIPAITDKYGSGDAAVKAIRAGADMLLCPSNVQKAYDGIEQAIQDGKLTEERIDESVVRILAAKIRIGLLS